MTARFRYMLLIAMLAGLSACGGGGDSGSSTPPVATPYPLSAAFQSYVQSAAVTNYAVSGGCTGTATNSKTALYSLKGYGGVRGYRYSNTLTLNFTNCTPASQVVVTSNDFDASHRPTAVVISGVEYDTYPNLSFDFPVSAKVGDTAPVASINRYSDSTMTQLIGTESVSFVVEAYGTSTSTAIVNVISKNYDASNSLLSTQQSRFRIDTSGSFSPVSIDVQFSTTSTTHLLYTAV